MASSTASELVREWERRAGKEFAPHFGRARTYFTQTVSELASDEAAWTITDHAGHTLLLLAGDTAFALVAFSGPPEGVEIKGALHPLDEGVIRVSFSDQLGDEVTVQAAERFRPIVRRWSFDWHGRLQLPIEYWLPLAPSVRVDSAVQAMLPHHERQRGMAHKLARAAGWPMPRADSPTSGSTGPD
jgi:hypothetical protein